MKDVRGLIKRRQATERRKAAEEERRALRAAIKDVDDERVEQELDLLREGLARHLRSWRATAMLTQQTAAEVIGIHYRQLQRLEDGDASTNPELRTLLRVAHALNVSVAKLLDARRKGVRVSSRR